MVELSPALWDGTAPLLPGVNYVREVSLRVAQKVIQAAVEEGVATAEGTPEDVGELDAGSRADVRSGLPAVEVCRG
jgi:Malic enzyme